MPDGSVCDPALIAEHGYLDGLLSKAGRVISSAGEFVLTQHGQAAVTTFISPAGVFRTELSKVHQ
jgi:hypothetical protein